MPATSSAPSRSGAHQLTPRTASSTSPSRSTRSSVREGREIAMNESQHRWPRGAVWHVEDRSLPDQASEPVGRLNAGHAQQMNDALQKGAVVGEQLCLVPREEIGRRRRLEQRHQRVVAELHADLGLGYGGLKQAVGGSGVALDELGDPLAIGASHGGMRSDGVGERLERCSSERCCSSSHCRIAQSSSTSWAVATSNGLSSERRDERVAAQRLDHGGVEAGRGRYGRRAPARGAPRWSGAPLRAAVPWPARHGGPPRTISRQKSSRNSRSVCGRDFSDDHGISSALSRTKGLRRMLRNAGLLSGMASAGNAASASVEFGVIERRHVDDGVLDAMRLQEARAHLLDGVVAAREDDAQAAVVRGQRHEVGKGVARCLLEQALDAFDEDDLAVLRAEDGAKPRASSQAPALQPASRRNAAARIPRRESRTGNDPSASTPTASLPTADLPLPAGPVTSTT